MLFLVVMSPPVSGAGAEAAESEEGAPPPPPVELLLGTFGNIGDLLSTSYRERQFSDLEIRCGGDCDSIFCHRFVLGAVSAHLKRLLQEQQVHAPGEDAVLVLPQVHPAHMRAVVKFVYTGKLVFKGSDTDAIKELMEDIIKIDARFEIPGATKRAPRRPLDDGDQGGGGGAGGSGGGGGHSGGFAPPSPPKKRPRPSQNGGGGGGGGGASDKGARAVPTGQQDGPPLLSPPHSLSGDTEEETAVRMAEVDDEVVELDDDDVIVISDDEDDGGGASGTADKLLKPPEVISMKDLEREMSEGTQSAVQVTTDATSLEDRQANDSSADVDEDDTGGMGIQLNIDSVMSNADVGDIESGSEGESSPSSVDQQLFLYNHFESFPEQLVGLSNGDGSIEPEINGEHSSSKLRIKTQPEDEDEVEVEEHGLQEQEEAKAERQEDESNLFTAPKIITKRTSKSTGRAAVSFAKKSTCFARKSTSLDVARKSTTSSSAQDADSPPRAPQIVAKKTGGGPTSSSSRSSFDIDSLLQTDTISCLDDFDDDDDVDDDLIDDASEDPYADPQPSTSGMSSSVMEQGADVLDGDDGAVVEVENAEEEEGDSGVGEADRSENEGFLDLPPPISMPPAPGKVIHRGKWIDVDEKLRKIQSTPKSRPNEVRKYNYKPFISISGKSKQSTLDRMENEVDGEHRCQYCEKVYARLSSLRAHMSREHNPNMSACCPECGKCLSGKSAIKKHLLSHRPREEWPYQCPVCLAKGKDTFFQAKGDLPKHLTTRIHRDDVLPEIGSVGWAALMEQSVRLPQVRLMNQRANAAISSHSAQETAAAATAAASAAATAAASAAATAAAAAATAAASAVARGGEVTAPVEDDGLRNTPPALSAPGPILVDIPPDSAPPPVLLLYPAAPQPQPPLLDRVPPAEQLAVADRRDTTTNG